jgi:hypothetical protein
MRRALWLVIIFQYLLRKVQKRFLLNFRLAPLIRCAVNLCLFDRQGRSGAGGGRSRVVSPPPPGGGGLGGQGTAK